MSPPRPTAFFSGTAAGSVGALGEAGLIRAIRRWLGDACPPSPHGIGDDCAVLPAGPGSPGAAGRSGSGAATLVTVDPVIRGVHFDDGVPAGRVGAKLLKRNLSDIAAMGGAPRAAVVALALDPRVSARWLEAFYRGLAREGRRHGCPIVGGDVARLAGSFVATLTLLGAAPERPLTRAGARAGDSICVTGRLGRSLPTGHHYRFTPRLAEGAWLAGRPEVRSAMDVSDGLDKDLGALCPAGTVPGIDPDRLPRRAGATVAQALGDGEDYELVFTLAEETDWDRFLLSWRRRFPRTPLSRIGRLVADPGHRKKDTGRSLPRTGRGGYDHFAQA